MPKPPDFLIVGVRKAATSWLWKQFTDHPQVYAHPKKELCYFNLNYDKRFDWYCDQFSSDKRVAMEATPGYFRADLAARIKSHLPQAKIVVSLRNPTDRAISDYKFWRFLGACNVSFIEAWRYDLYGIRSRGHYDVHLKVFLEHYPDMLVILYDEICANQSLMINKICQHVNVCEHHSEYASDRWMPGNEHLVRHGLGGEDLLSTYRRMTEHYGVTNADYEEVRAYYGNTVKMTGKIIDRDLTEWSADPRWFKMT